MKGGAHGLGHNHTTFTGGRESPSEDRRTWACQVELHTWAAFRAGILGAFQEEGFHEERRHQGAHHRAESCRDTSAFRAAWHLDRTWVGLQTASLN